MRPPLLEMNIRTAVSDQSFKDRRIRSKLSAAASPIGGDFGMVRSGGHKPHQGWDLYARPGTLVFAIADAELESISYGGEYGIRMCLRLLGPAMDAIARRHSAKHLYAFYAHLSVPMLPAKPLRVREGQVIALSGNSGNATGTPPHLHFEIRTKPRPVRGLDGRINPGEILGFRYYQCVA